VSVAKAGCGLAESESEDAALKLPLRLDPEFLVFIQFSKRGSTTYSVHFRGGYRDTIEVDVRHQGTAVGLGISHARLRCSLTGMSAVTYLDN